MYRFRRKHPEAALYLDGKLIVLYYADRDQRNKGEASLTLSNDFNPGDIDGFMMFSPVKWFMEYKGEKFEVDYTISLKTYHNSDEQTLVYKIARVI